MTVWIFLTTILHGAGWLLAAVWTCSLLWFGCGVLGPVFVPALERREARLYKAFLHRKEIADEGRRRMIREA